MKYTKIIISNEPKNKMEDFLRKNKGNYKISKSRLRIETRGYFIFFMKPVLDGLQGLYFEEVEIDNYCHPCERFYNRIDYMLNLTNKPWIGK